MSYINKVVHITFLSDDAKYECSTQQVLKIMLELSLSFNYLVKIPLFKRLTSVSPAEISFGQLSCALQQASVLLKRPRSLSFLAISPPPHQSVPNTSMIIAR